MGYHRSVRSMTLLLLGRREESRADFESFRAGSKDPRSVMVTEVILASFDNRLDEARKLLDEAKAAHPADLKYLETIVRGWATLASEGLRHKSPKAAELATEAIAHLEAAWSEGSSRPRAC